MGSFDIIAINCPNCGCKNEVQSKAGVCRMKNYTRRNAPPEILVDVSDQPIICYLCGTQFSVKVQTISEIEIIKRGF